MTVHGADASSANHIFGSQEPDDLCEGGFKDMDALVVPVGGTDEIVYSKSTSLQVRAEFLFLSGVSFAGVTLSWQCFRCADLAVRLWVGRLYHGVCRERGAFSGVKEENRLPSADFRCEERGGHADLQVPPQRQSMYINQKLLPQTTSDTFTHFSLTRTKPISKLSST